MADEQQSGILILVLGDSHIPHRASELPVKFRQILTPHKMNSVLCTGNIGSKETYEWAKGLSGNFHIVRGDFEDPSLKDIPEEKVIEISGMKFGLIHGHQIIPWGDEEALWNKATAMGADVLICGHTHEQKFSSNEGIQLVNPGSVTGAYSTQAMDPFPSFMIMEVKEKQVLIYSYVLIDDDLKCEFSKFDRK